MRKIAGLVLITAGLFLCGCHTIKERQQDFSGLDDAVFTPDNVFEYKSSVYFTYNGQDKDFYLEADLPASSSGPLQSADFKIKTGPAPVLPGAAMPDITELWQDALVSYAMEIAPAKDKTGVVITLFSTDGVIYRGRGGELEFGEIKNIPQDIEIIRSVNHNEFMENIFAKIRESATREHPGHYKFILHLQDYPGAPFIYIDIGQNNAVLLRLPGFYEIKKDLLPFGYTANFVYSLVVNGHVIPIIKAPFTTAHRLLNQLMVSVSRIFTPRIKDSKEAPPPLAGGEFMDIDGFNAYLDKNVADRTYKGKLTLLLDGEEFFSHFQLAALKAQKDILVRLYVFSVDPYSLGLADMLKSKSNGGVEVRVLLDELNTVINWTRKPKVLSEQKYQMPSIKKYLKKDSGVKVRTLPNQWISFSHTKVIVIDDNLAYTGGMNFGEAYRYFWHDMMFALEGPVVGRLKEDFKKAWHYAGAGGDFAAAGYLLLGGKKSEYAGSTEGMADVRLLYTLPGAPEIFEAQLEAVKRAKNRIYLQNPYFSDARIVNELIKARARGVDVRVILPSSNNVGIMDKNNLIKTNTLIKNGIRVYMYSGMTHIKAGIFDGWASVGSANFDRYSLYINQEMNLGISDPAFVKELEERLFQKDFAASMEVKEPFSIAWTSYVANALNPMK